MYNEEPLEISMGGLNTVRSTARETIEIQPTASEKQHDAADRLIQYLRRTRHICIQDGHQPTAALFICASDASFTDNALD